jgi:DNA-binding MarR family transcriptional regulator
MKKTQSTEKYFKLWLLVGQLSHSIILARQRELDELDMPVRQYHVLRIIQDLGKEATLSKIAVEAERKENVISRQTIRMEKDGLIKRVKTKPKSNLLRLELTSKGLGIVNKSKKSPSIEAVFSSISEEECDTLEIILTKLIDNIADAA